LHGGPYQSGLPDVLCAADGRVCFLEFKWVPAHRPMTWDELVDRGLKKLTDLQRLDLDRVVAAEVPAKVLVGCPEGTGNLVAVKQWGTPHQFFTRRYRGTTWDVSWLLWHP
jgi:hypothetical protein